jgi:hypothetical protein
MVSVFDPREKAVSKSSDKRLQVATIGEIFPSQEEAQKAAEADLKAMESSRESTKTDEDEYPPLPSSWKDVSVEDWISTLSDAKEAAGGGSYNPKKGKDISQEIDASIGDVKAWWDLV